MKRRIIIGFDPEKRGTDALRLGRLLARILHAEPVVVTALPWPSYLLPPADLQDLVDAETRAGFDLARAELQGLAIRTRGLACDSPAAALCEIAAEERADLIVLGSCHHGPVGRTLLGSVGESLVHGASCAVAVAPRDCAGSKDQGLLRVGVAFDGSSESWSSLNTAIVIASRSRGELTILTVADYPHYGYPPTRSVLTAGEVRDAEHEEKRRLLELARSTTPAGLPAESQLLTGDAGTLLAQASSDFDLIVAGSRAYGPLRRTLVGSATRRLLSDSGCPALILPRGVGVDPLGLLGERAGPTVEADALA